MNVDVKRKWVEALRSGEYKQSKNALQRSDGYCCLGVLCDLYAKEYPEAKWSDGLSFYPIGLDGKHPKFENEDYAFDEDLPPEVRDWAELTSIDPRLISGGSVVTCIHCNDNLKLTFPEIATLIEESL